NFAMSIPEAASEVQASFAEQKEQIAAMVDSSLEVFKHGSFGEIVQMRLKEYGLLLPAVVFFYPYVLAMFLIGMFAARKGYLNNIEANKGFFRKLVKWGFLVGIPLNIIYGVLAVNLQADEMSWLKVLFSLLSGFGGPLLTLGYVSSIVLLFFRGTCARVFQWIAPVGRMALTNYLLHSIIGAILFHSYGFGLYGQVSIWQGMILTIVIFLLQIPLSNVWLNYFRFGPFEWLWRSLTYWKRQPMRK
ncbi:MAG: DUF418 domain-containing protein, partial [Bacteroidota bacterium]